LVLFAPTSAPAKVTQPVIDTEAMVEAARTLDIGLPKD
jgi:hypothetical protein